MSAPAAATAAPVASDADLERRFGGLRRLYGDAAYARLREARVAVVGLGGVGSWTAEALARSGVAALVLVDADHVAESNVHRQVQALGSTLGLAKGEALRLRIADIHPGCAVSVIDDFVAEGNWPALLPGPVDAVVDACDQVRAKQVLAQWAQATGTPLVCVGAAGGKRDPARVEVATLREATHDPLLASLRQRLRQAARRSEGEGASGSPSRTDAAAGLRCVFSREAVALPEACEPGALDGSLNCAGYGSSVTVTATFGMVAAAEALSAVLRAPASAAAPSPLPGPPRGAVPTPQAAAETSG